MVRLKNIARVVDATAFYSVKNRTTIIYGLLVWQWDGTMRVAYSVTYQIPLSRPVLIVVANLSICALLLSLVVYQISLYSSYLNLLLRPQHLSHNRRPTSHVSSFSDNNKRSGRKILMKGRITGGRFFTVENLMWHQRVGSNAVSCSSRADAVIDLLLRTPQQWLPMLYNGPKIASCPWRSEPPWSSNTWCLGPIRVYSRSSRYLDRFRRFCRAHERDQQTDKQTQTDHATLSEAKGRI